MQNELPNVDLRILYLTADALQEGKSAGSQVVSAVTDYLAAHANFSPGRRLDDRRTEYDLGQVALVCISPDLNLAETISTINDDYRARCTKWGVKPSQPQYGVAVQVHLPSSAQATPGPTILHYPSARSNVLGKVTAIEMAAAAGRPVAQQRSDKTRDFIVKTTMLALVVECAQETLPAWAAGLGGDFQAAGIARLLMRLAVVADVTQPSKRGMHLGEVMVPDWAKIEATRPQALVVLHLSDIQDADRYYLFRPWTPQPVWAEGEGHYPEGAQFAQYITDLLEKQQALGRPMPRGVQFLNEPNFHEESGLPDGSEEAAQKTLAWGLQVVAALRQRWGSQIEIHSPPLSFSIVSAQGKTALDFYKWIQPLVEVCDVLNVHSYWAGWAGLYEEWRTEAFSYRAAHDLFPDKPVFISECGREAGGTREYGQELAWYFLHLDSYVRYACPFIWNAPAEWGKWVLQGRPAGDELAATAPAARDYAALWGQAVPYLPSSPLAAHWRRLVNTGQNPGAALAVAKPKADMEAGFFLRCVITLEAGNAREYWLKP